jgi:hypothetical protein
VYGEAVPVDGGGRHVRRAVVVGRGWESHGCVTVTCLFLSPPSPT